MVTISLAMIVKNEEKNIRRCLNSVYGVVDEIIIVDTGSKDKTKEICSLYTDKVYDFKWIDDFSAARNYSYELATMEYILWLDADDYLLPEDVIKLKKLKKNISSEYNAIMMKYVTGLDSKGNETFSYYRERLTKKSCNFQWNEPVHEYLDTSGPIGESNIRIIHGKKRKTALKSGRNLKIYERYLKEKGYLSPRGTYYYARELKDHNRIKEAINQYELFLDTNMGWLEDNIAACSDLAKCYFEINLDTLALTTLFKSFLYDTPRAEVCCQIGYHYQEKEEYERAIYWFQLILTLKMPKNCWGFMQPDCWAYIPLIECAVCYDRLGDYKRALQFNNRALKHKPDSIQAKRNQDYLQKKLSAL